MELLLIMQRYNFESNSQLMKRIIFYNPVVANNAKIQF